MLIRLIILLTVVPFAEFYILYKLSHVWGGFGVTLAVIVYTGILGGWLARREGLKTLRRIQDELTAARLPADAMIDGLLILIAGALLITPGVMTDALGFLLLLPPSRAVARNMLKRWIRRKIARGEVHFQQSGSIHVDPGASGFGPVKDEPPPGSPPIEEGFD